MDVKSQVLRFVGTFLLYVLGFSLATASIEDSNPKAGQLTLSKPAQRIIALTPDIAELLYEVGAEKQVVGVSIDTNYPKSFVKLPQVSDLSHINIEKVLMLKPNLIVAWQGGNPQSSLDALHKLGIPVLTINPQKITDIAHIMRVLGQLTGNDNTANQQAKKFLVQYHHLKQQYAHQRPRIKTFIEIGTNPLFTIGNQSIQGQALTLCGGENIFANLTTPASEVSIEAVLQANPQVIITLGDINLSYWRRWPFLHAVKNNQLQSIPADLLSRNDMRLLRGIKQLCQILQGARQGLLSPADHQDSHKNFDK